jgi:hypothetical protein
MANIIIPVINFVLAGLVAYIAFAAGALQTTL